MKPPSARPRARRDLTVVELDGEAVIYDAASASIHHLNQSAALVFSLCDGEETPEGLAPDIAAAFGADEAVVESDVGRILREFRAAGLLEGEPSDGGA